MIGSPWQSHYGLFVMLGNEPHVIHNQLGGQKLEPLADFLEGRKVRSVIPTPVSGGDAGDILNKYRNMDSKEFNLFTNNCEQFAHRLAGRPVYNREFAAAIVFFLFLLASYFVYRG